MPLNVQNAHPDLTNALQVPTALLLVGIPTLLILAFAVFGPTARARNIVLWGLLLVVVISAGWM